MKKSTAALATLVAAAGLAGGTTLTAQAHPTHLQSQTASHQTSRVAITRLQAMLQTPGTAIERGIVRPNDGGGAFTH